MSLSSSSTRLITALNLALLLPACPARSSGQLYAGRSEFNGEVIVEERRDGVRELRFESDGATQSAIRPGAPLDLQLAYTRAAMVALGVVPQPRRVLLIGLGGGAMPMFLRALDPEMHLDVVDIDPAVVQAARRWFGFREDSRLKAHVGDGRRFVEEAKGHYDLIFLDAYGRSSIPTHLTTAEFLATVRARLAPGGVAVGNVWSGAVNTLYGPMRQTWSQAFGGFCEIAVPGSGNRIFLGRAEAAVFDTKAMGEAAATLARRHALPFDLAQFARPGCLQAPFTRNAEVLRDPPPAAREKPAQPSRPATGP